MKNKTQKAIRKSTLHRGEIVPINDPLVEAALDQMRKQKNPVVPDALREHARRTAEAMRK